MNVPKLPLRSRSRNTANQNRGSISARDHDTSSSKFLRAKSSAAAAAKQPPMSARGASEDKPRTPTGRPHQRRVLSARVREDVRESNTTTTSKPPPAPSSPTKHGWALVRDKVTKNQAKKNLPRSTGFAPARKSSSVTLSDEVRRSVDEVDKLRDQVKSLRSELTDKSLRLISANKRADQAARYNSATTISQKDSSRSEKIYVRDENAIRTAENDRDAAIAELKVLQARFRTVQQRSDENETMLKKRIERIVKMERETNSLKEKYSIDLHSKDQGIALLREELELAVASAADKAAKKEHDVRGQIEAEALRVQVARLAKELHDTKIQRDDALQLNKKEKLTELMKIQESTALNEKVRNMKREMKEEERKRKELEEKLRESLKKNNQKKESSSEATSAKTAAAAAAAAAANTAKEWETKLAVERKKTAKQQKELEKMRFELIKFQENMLISSTEDKRKEQMHKEEVEKLNSVIYELREKLMLQTTTVEERNATIVELETKIQALHEEHDLDHNNYVSTLKKTSDAEHKVIETLRVRMTAAEAKGQEIDGLRNKLSKMEQDRADTERRFREVQSNHVLLEKKNKKSATDNKNQAMIIVRLQQDLLAQKEKMMHEYTANIDQLKIEYADKIKLLEVAKANDWERAHRSAAEKNHELMEKWKKENDELKKIIESLKNEIERLNQLLEEEKERYSVATTEHESMMSELQLMLSAANERAVSAGEHAKSIEVLSAAEMDRLRVEIRKLQATNEESEKKENVAQSNFTKERLISTALRSKLATTINELELEKGRRERLESSKESAMELNTKMKSYEEEIDRLNKLLKKWNEKNNHFQQLEKQLVSLKSSVEHNNKETAAARAAMRVMDNKCKQDLLQLTQAHDTYIQQLKQEHDVLLKEMKEKNEALNAMSAKKNQKDCTGMEKMKRELKRLQDQLKTSDELAAEAEKNYQKSTEELKKLHLNVMDSMKLKISGYKTIMKELEEEIKKLKKTMAKELSDKLAEKLADKAEALDVETTKLKKENLHHKRTIKEQIERLKKLRENLTTNKKNVETLEIKNIDQESTIQKLKQNLSKLKKLKKSSDMEKENSKSANANAAESTEKITEAMRMIASLQKTCNDLSDAVKAETSSSGYLSNLNVLIKTAEVSQCEKRSAQLKKELSNNKKIHSVLMYNIKYGEQILARFDKNAAVKQTKARTDSLNKLEHEIEIDRKKEKRFQETSDNNVEELEGLKKSAQEKLKESRGKRKKLTLGMTRGIAEALEVLK